MSTVTTSIELELQDITPHVQAMLERKSFLEINGSSIRPIFGKTVLKILLLMEWPLFSGDKKTWLRCYAALFPHGKVFVAETFFTNCENESDLGGQYLGSPRVFTVRYQTSEYDPLLDDKLADLLAAKLNLQVENV